MYALRERRVHVTQEDFEMAVAKVIGHFSDVLTPLSVNSLRVMVACINCILY